MYAKKLREANVPEPQAEVHAQALRAPVEERLATKQDIELVKREIKEVEARLLHQIDLVCKEIELGRKDVLIKLRGIMVAGTSVLAALIGVAIALVRMR
jgi:hypothetical protein